MIEKQSIYLIIFEFLCFFFFLNLYKNNNELIKKRSPKPILENSDLNPFFIFLIISFNSNDKVIIFFTISGLICIAPKGLRAADQLGNILVGINNKLYRKLRGRAYRSYYICINKGCEGEVMVNDLKGGVIREIRSHESFCENINSDMFIVNKN